MARTEIRARTTYWTRWKETTIWCRTDRIDSEIMRQRTIRTLSERNAFVTAAEHFFSKVFASCGFASLLL